jgi:hypothetical protein
MGVLPVPEAVKDMSNRIDQILEILRTQNNILSQMLPQSAKLETQFQELTTLGRKLEVMNGSLEVIKDSIRLK